MGIGSIWSVFYYCLNVGCIIVVIGYVDGDFGFVYIGKLSSLVVLCIVVNEVGIFIVFCILFIVVGVYYCIFGKIGFVENDSEVVLVISLVGVIGEVDGFGFICWYVEIVRKDSLLICWIVFGFYDIGWVVYSGNYRFGNFDFYGSGNFVGSNGYGLCIGFGRNGREMEFGVVYYFCVFVGISSCYF